MDTADLGAYTLLFNAMALIPVWHYFLAFLLVFLTFLYHFLEFHFFEDVFSGFRGRAVALTFHSSSPLYEYVVSRCRILHGRYLATPWLSSPHLQTLFLSYHARSPVFSYTRQLFHAPDGGTVALDWLLNSDVDGGAFPTNKSISKDDTIPIVVVIPGLTSDSAAAYVKHLAFSMAKHGWNTVVINHRGQGGISLTSDCFYNAGWTEDARAVIDYLHHKYPMAPLFVVGTSVGANILVKYLGEDGENVPVAGAVALGSPWDILIVDRFISRRFLQKFYDRALASGLQDYAQLHKPRISRIANWEGIKKSRSLRDFDHHATCLVGKFETVDTYYRRCSSSSYVGNVRVPLLCISALDDPVCTREAIPWDECKANKNVVLATTEHGGHLAFFEGITASSMWWVRAVIEYLDVLHSSPCMHVQKKDQSSGPHMALDSSIDQGPYVNVAEDGLVAAVGNDQVRDESVEEVFSDLRKTERDVPVNEGITDEASKIEEDEPLNAGGTVRRVLNVLARRERWSIWLLAYIAVITTWPMVGSVFDKVFGKKRRNVLPAAFLKR